MFYFPPAKTQLSKYLYLLAIGSPFCVGLFAHSFRSLSRTVP